MRLRPLRTGLAAAVLSACTGFGHYVRSEESQRTSGPAYRERMAAESIVIARTPDTTYRRRMLDLRRRALLVHTDSLARLYAAIPRSAEAALPALRQEITCEAFRLMERYGGAATQRASQRMIDSLERTGFQFAREAERMHAAKGPDAVIRADNCGIRLPAERMPDSLFFEPRPLPLSASRKAVVAL